MASRRNRTKSIIDEISQLHTQQLASPRQAKESHGLVVDIADQIRNLCREILKSDKKLERLCQLRFLLHEQAQETHDKSSEALESLLESERHIKDN